MCQNLARLESGGLRTPVSGLALQQLGLYRLAACVDVLKGLDVLATLTLAKAVLAERERAPELPELVWT